jgi:hypothetical protein
VGCDAISCNRRTMASVRLRYHKHLLSRLSIDDLRLYGLHSSNRGVEVTFCNGAQHTARTTLVTTSLTRALRDGAIVMCHSWLMWWINACCRSSDSAVTDGLSLLQTTFNLKQGLSAITRNVCFREEG